ncbi:MAG: Lrp/AsnC family transcriptional regulator [Planctomycetes bacterium]|nr:Lrp/AsnC family transcriptional regulator [Planctomycetota bacterium]
MKIDAIDRAIVDILQKNGRTSNKEMAQALEVSEGTIRNRIARLIKSEYLSVKGLVDPDKNIDFQLVFLGVKVAVCSDLRSTASSIKSMPYVKAVTIVSGRYDLLVEVFLPNHELITFISDHLSKDTAITSTENFVSVESAGKWL